MKRQILKAEIRSSNEEEKFCEEGGEGGRGAGEK